MEKRKQLNVRFLDDIFMFMRAWFGYKIVTRLSDSSILTSEPPIYEPERDILSSTTDVVEIDLFDVVVNWNLVSR